VFEAARALHYDAVMPTLAHLAQSIITLYAGDHLPPHFHVRMNDGREALVVIDSLQVLRGSVPMRELAEAITWARANQAALSAKWTELNP